MRGVSVSEAAKLLGYTTGHVYKLIADGEIIPCQRAPIRIACEDIMKFRDRPPKGKRPRATGQDSDDLTAQLADLRHRIERLEKRLRENRTEDAFRSADPSWQRKAVAARSAILQLSDIGQDYEAVIANYESVVQKQNEAQASLASARETHGKIARRYRETINGLIGPNDSDELNDWHSPP
ncbi:MAG: helix-turn-helix domain-containing protein [Mycobacterium sp.]